jgi:sugar phosphate isomerase/epimerase
MIQLGIFARTFVRPNLDETLDAVKAHGLDCVQFNLSCVGLPTLPDRIDSKFVDLIRTGITDRSITMAAISGTFNMIDPDIERRYEGLRRLRVLASTSKDMGTSIITLCTGTRDPVDMWRRHPDNNSPEAWTDLLASMQEALQIAEDNEVTLAFEPEVNNVVDSAAKGRRLLNEMRSPRLKVVMDGANLFQEGRLAEMREVLDQAFALLGDQIVIAHAKDLSRDGDAGHEAAGTGLLDYDHYLSLLGAVGFDGPLILHSLSEVQVDTCVAFLKQKVEQK